MQIEKKLKIIDQLKTKIDGYGNPSSEAQRNYYSNSMKGNTLTRDET